MELDLNFQVPLAFASVDTNNGVIRGVSLMTGDLTAEGHDLEVDDTTLAQVIACAKAAPGGKIPVKLNHGSGVENLCGYIDAQSVVLDGARPGRAAKVRGDWHLLQSHDEYAKIMEKAQKMPECFGLSAAFKGGGETLLSGAKKGKKAARCTKLLAVDCVAQPAANPEGLFSAKTYPPVDSRSRGMADINNPNDQAPAWAQQLIQKIDGLEQTVKQQGEAHAQLVEQINGLDGPDLAELANMTDAQLEEAGYDVQAVRAAVEQAVASGELTEGEPGGEAHGTGTPAAGAPGSPASGSPTAAAAAAGAGATAMSAKEVQNLIAFEIGKVRKQSRDAAEAAEAEHAFSIIMEKVDALSAENGRIATELAAKNAEVTALKQTLRTSGVRAVPAGVEGPMLFHGKGAPAGSFEQLVSAKVTELSTGGKLTPVQARAQAVQFCIRHHQAAFSEYRQRGGKIELGQ